MPSSQKDAVAADFHTRLNARFRGPLMGFFSRRLKDRAPVEDLTQETLLRVIRAQAAGHIDDAESYYVFQVAANLLRDHLRLSHRVDPQVCVPIEEAVANELEQQLVEDLTPERVLISKDSLKEALGFLEELGERTRDIFVLFRLENMKQKDIARAYGIGQSTVEKHVMRAVAHLAARQGSGKR